MTKSSLLFAIIALGMTAVAASLWVTRPPDSDARVAILESTLKEANATIARLSKQHSSTTLAPHSTAGGGMASLISADSAPAPGSVAHTQNDQGTTGGGNNDQEAAATASSGPPVKSDKRLAEAEARYSDLINQFGLQPDEKEAFKNLAAKRDDIRNRVFAKLADPTLTPAQRQAILSEGQAAMAQIDGSIRQFLNNDQDYNTFLKYDHQNVERNQMNDARPIFEKNGAPLSSSQEQWLNDEFWKLRTSDPALGDAYSAETLAGRRIDGQYIARLLAKHDKDTAIALQDARTQMSQPQIAALGTVRYQQRVRLEAHLWNMARTTGQR
ncbi:MAG: hypothetical protein JWO89_2271 [Verrucomicrobiaceae bacterium]|nr:hypothetical protein [Verrucomicrobiaceae bacterium]